MKALAYRKYGPPDNLELQDVEMPAVESDAVLVRVRAASVNWHDHHFLTGTPLMARLMAAGLSRPKHPVLRSDLAGRLKVVGAKVSELRPGDEVYGSTKGTLGERSLSRCDTQAITGALGTSQGHPTRVAS